ncbi:hypothetical protein [Arsenophonus nasoniae]|uniref:Replication protein n=1 Tax=Arsenophonus nasoniae TaxID=638 RepID=A0AA95GNR9_9GAMM|nr:hypothetical protein [Arsenophonus nasoniae]WGM01933.1 hypothetical protein QE210_02035 [Arsenophonus nasoniae]
MNIQNLLDRPIAFHRSFVTITKSVTSALMLSQAIYWAKRGKTHSDGEAWFYKTQADWEEETGLSRREQETARKKLIGLGVMNEKRTGVPARIFFSIDFNKLEELLDCTNKNGVISQSSMAESANLACTKCTNSDGGKRQSNTETTTETTTKNKNILIEPVRSEVEKTESEITKPNQNPIDLAFEGIFWPQVQRKVGKQSAKSSFKTQFRLWRKETGKTAEQFAEFLVADIRLRLQAKQFGFEKLHPATYLNGKRWLDDKPVIQSHQLKPQATTTSTFTVSNGLVFF